MINLYNGYQIQSTKEKELCAIVWCQVTHTSHKKAQVSLKFVNNFTIIKRFQHMTNDLHFLDIP